MTAPNYTAKDYRREERTSGDMKDNEAIRADLEQIAIYATKDEITWEFERDEGIFTYTVYPLKGTARAEWVEWDDNAQDWTGRRVPVADVRHLIPAQLYSTG
jgi:hypothetical protein